MRISSKIIDGIISSCTELQAARSFLRRSLENVVSSSALDDWGATRITGDEEEALEGSSESDASEVSSDEQDLRDGRLFGSIGDTLAMKLLRAHKTSQHYRHRKSYRDKQMAYIQYQ